MFLEDYVNHQVRGSVIHGHQGSNFLFFNEYIIVNEYKVILNHIHFKENKIYQKYIQPDWCYF